MVFSRSGFGLKKNVRSGSEQKNLDPKHWLKQFPLHYFSFSSQVYHLYSLLCFPLIVPCLNYQGKFLSKQELKFAVREVRRVQVGQTIFFFFSPKNNCWSMKRVAFWQYYGPSCDWITGIILSVSLTGFVFNFLLN